MQKWAKLVPSSRFGKNKDYPIKKVGNSTNIYNVYEGSTVTFQCETSFYFFSHGIRFSTKDQKGIRSVLPGNTPRTLLGEI